MRRFSSRPKKNYAWERTAAVGNFTGATILNHQIADGADYSAGVGRSTPVNLQRVIVDCVVMVHANDLEDVLILVCSPCAWSVAILDRDSDPTNALDPGIESDVADEKLLAWGLTDRIGWGTIEDPLVAGAGATHSQSAAFMASARIRIDTRTNRQFSADDLLTFSITRLTGANFSREDAHAFEVFILAAALVKIP